MKEKPAKVGKKTGGGKKNEPKEVELTPRQLREKRKEEARQRAAESRKIVAAGTVAWTGKLPAALLNEHCQSCKWNKADYHVREKDGMFTAAVALSRVNPKTKERESVRFVPSFEPQDTALAARHYAATYGLHRVLSHRNVKMMLPPPHRDYWSELDKEKAAAPPNLAWKWAEDPFQAVLDRQNDEAERRKASQKRTDERATQQLVRQINDTLRLEKKSTEEHAETESEGGRNSSADERVRSVKFNHVLTMSASFRSKAEAVIRQYNGFHFSVDNALDASHPRYPQILSTLRRIGFLDFQIREALEYANTLGDCLTWLLIHVPEDDLPKVFMPSNLAVTARVSSTMAVESATAKLKGLGYSDDVARATVKRAGGSFEEAAVMLTHQLAETAEAEPLDENIWMEEIEGIKAMEPEMVLLADPKSCALRLKGGNTITFYKSKGYPNSIPAIAISTLHSIPKYVKLDAIRRTALYALEHLGECMLLTTAQHFEDTFEDIKTHPCKLVQIAVGVSGVDENAIIADQPKKTNCRTKRKRILLDANELRAQQQNRMQSEKGREMLKSRQLLPAWQKRELIVDLAQKHQVILVTGETGSGKSTQIVQFILDHLIESGNGGSANILCTQPRRISVLGLAQRVADERVCSVGSQVGYIIRGETKTSDSTQITFVTCGVLLRMIHGDPNVLNQITHVVVDEVHERSLDGDFLLILLKRICKINKKIKIILMSATVDPKRFMDYFEPVTGLVGRVHVEGRTFPVKTVFVGEIIKAINYVPEDLRADGITDIGQIVLSLKNGIDYNLIAATVRYIHSIEKNNSGSILIFMSGAAEIDRTLKAIDRVDTESVFWALPLHASLAPSDQKRVFQNAPKGKRKVVVSTNVAETSITIPDVTFVIDSGRAKEAIFRGESHALHLVDGWISQASAIQRMGRAGRVRPGTCFKLYTERLQEQMRPRPLPEILRAPLETLCLSVKAMGFQDVGKFLSGALDTPESASIDSAIMELQQLGVLDNKEELTPLGRHIALIPADPKTSKLLVLSTIFGCYSRGVIAAAVLASKSPFVNSRDKRDEVKEIQRKFGLDGAGDILISVRAFEAWCEKAKTMSRGELKRWCGENFVSYQACLEIQSTARQLTSSLMQAELIPTCKNGEIPIQYTWQSDNIPLLLSILGASLIPNVAEIVLPEKVYKSTNSGAIELDPAAQKIRFFAKRQGRVFIHPGSSLFGVNSFRDNVGYCSYASSIISSKQFINTVNPLSLFGLLFFSQTIEVDPLGSGIVIDGWTGLKCWPRVGILIRFLKDIFAELLRGKFTNPQLDISNHPVIALVNELLVTDGRGNAKGLVGTLATP